MSRHAMTIFISAESNVRAKSESEVCQLVRLSKFTHRHLQVFQGPRLFEFHAFDRRQLENVHEFSASMPVFGGFTERKN